MEEICDNLIGDKIKSYYRDLFLSDPMGNGSSFTAGVTVD
jgi:hypothetical protein